MKDLGLCLLAHHHFPAASEPLVESHGIYSSDDWLKTTWLHN